MWYLQSKLAYYKNSINQKIQGLKRVRIAWTFANGYKL